MLVVIVVAGTFSVLLAVFCAVIVFVEVEVMVLTGAVTVAVMGTTCVDLTTDVVPVFKVVAVVTVCCRFENLAVDETFRWDANDFSLWLLTQ